MAKLFNVYRPNDEEFVASEFHKFLRKTVREINYRREQEAILNRHNATFESVTEYYVKENVLGLIDVANR